MASPREPIRQAQRLKESVHLAIRGLAVSPIYCCIERFVTAGGIAFSCILDGLEVTYIRPFISGICLGGHESVLVGDSA